MKTNEKNNCRQLSKQNWTGEKTNDDINTGSLQRIADACELMASNYLKLQSDLKFQKDRADRNYELWRSEEKANRYLRANITRLKNKIKASEQKEPANAIA